MDTSIFCFATDLADEGVETVLDNVQQRGGLGGVTVAAAYHEGRDVFPHNPVRKVRFLESGAVFFRAGRCARTRLQPPVSDVARVAAGDGRGRGPSAGCAVRAWTVFLHNGALAAAHPDCAPENAFGDRYVTDLCPAHPDARAFARALAADSRALGVATICSESLHYHGLEHGYAHERYFVPLSAARPVPARALLLRALSRRGARAGVDGEAVARDAREAIERAFARRGARAASPSATSTCACASEIVTSLVAEVAAARGEAPPRVHRALGCGQGLRRRPAHRRPVADDRLAAGRRRAGGRGRLRRARGDGLRGRPGAGRARPGDVRRATPSPSSSARSTPDCDSARTCGRRSSWRASAGCARRLLPLRPDAAGRAGLDPRRRTP